MVGVADKEEVQDAQEQHQGWKAEARRYRLRARVCAEAPERQTQTSRESATERGKQRAVASLTRRVQSEARNGLTAYANAARNQLSQPPWRSHGKEVVEAVPNLSHPPCFTCRGAKPQTRGGSRLPSLAGLHFHRSPKARKGCYLQTMRKWNSQEILGLLSI